MQHTARNECAQPKAKLNDELPRMKWFVWFGVYLFAPLAIAWCIELTATQHRVWLAVLSVYLYVLGAMLMKALLVWRKAEWLLVHRSFTAIHYLFGRWRWFGMLLCEVFPLPMLAVHWLFSRRARHYRERARPCSKYGHDMRKLDEQADDAHLTHAQRAEEQIGSVDYDVWLCEKCDAVTPPFVSGSRNHF